MRIIISPAKKMRDDPDSLEPTALPQFLPQANRLLALLRGMEDPALRRLWGCNEAIAAQNLLRLRRMDLERSLTPAILSYEGIQYQYMAPGVFEDREFSYIDRHLRILSGFYGLLRPFDGVTPYRLEMQARLSVDGQKDLYAFWGNALANQLSQETDWILDLASKEYSRAVLPHLPISTNVISCTFGERIHDKIIEKGTMCKMARGAMVRYLAGQNITEPQAVQGFHGLGYAYCAEASDPTHFVFIKGGTP